MITFKSTSFPKGIKAGKRRFVWVNNKGRSDQFLRIDDIFWRFGTTVYNIHIEREVDL